MEEEPFIIAALMAEEERRRLEKKAAEGQQSPHHDPYQPLQHDQPASRPRAMVCQIGQLLVTLKEKSCLIVIEIEVVRNSLLPGTPKVRIMVRMAQTNNNMEL